MAPKISLGASRNPKIQERYQKCLSPAIMRFFSCQGWKESWWL